jgi:hypothetical protein
MTKKLSRKSVKVSSARPYGVRSWYYNVLSRYGYEPVVKNSSNQSTGVNTVISYLPRDIDQFIKLATVVLVATSFMYGYLVNKTVSITAEYSAIEQKLSDAENRLTTASSRVAGVESQLEIISETVIDMNQVEPTGFVSRDLNSGFTYRVGNVR